MSCEDCCSKTPCVFLDGNLQDMVDDTDPEKLNTKNLIDAKVRTAFFSNNSDEKKRACREVANFLSSNCKYQVYLVSSSISRITGYNDRKHKIPTS